MMIDLMQTTIINQEKLRRDYNDFQESFADTGVGYAVLLLHRAEKHGLEEERKPYL